jgi:TRAP-type C4-dicarboxylate transport system permease large subunit
VIQEVMPYLLVLLGVLLFLTYFPAVTLLLPNLLGG